MHFETYLEQCALSWLQTKTFFKSTSSTTSSFHNKVVHWVQVKTMSKWFIEHNAKIKKFVWHCDVVALYSQNFYKFLKWSVIRQNWIKKSSLWTSCLFSSSEYENRNQFLLKSYYNTNKTLSQESHIWSSWLRFMICHKLKNFFQSLWVRNSS